MATSYKKRAGTSGINGQLFETKLLSMILFRLQHDDTVEQFLLASNMDDIGSFDDICLRLKLTGVDRPILIFIQAKHKDDDDKYLEYDLIKEFRDSYGKVKLNFDSNKDDFFKENFNDIDCVFILYTNAKYKDSLSGTASSYKHARKLYQSSFSERLNKLISTGDAESQGFQTDCNDKDLQLVTDVILEEELTSVADHFAKFLNHKTSMNIMADNYILQYHVILAEIVVNISEVKSDQQKARHWREMTFRSNFFDTNDKVLVTLRKRICQQILKAQTIRTKTKSKVKLNSASVDTDESNVDKLITSFLTEPTALTLGPLIGTHVIYKEGNLHFTVMRPNEDVQKLQQINISQSLVDGAEEIAATNILLSLKLEVPVVFGNRDVTIGGEAKKVEKRLNTLTDFISDLCNKSILNDTHRTVVIDQTGGYFSLNNGIGSAVGNLLVHDSATKQLKFTDQPTTLPKNARTLLDNLSSKLSDLQSYRFDVRNRMTFPKLVFDYTDEAKEILNKVVIYERQGNHSGVESILKNEIEHHLRTHGPHNLPIKSDTVFMHYHDTIQKLWMSKDKQGTYFTKSSNIYQDAIDKAVKEPQIYAMQTTFYMNNLNYTAYSLSETATKFLESLQVHTSTIIVTDISTLTALKVIQCYKQTNRYVVLDLECMFNLLESEFRAFINELENTENLLIAVINYVKGGPRYSRRLDKFAEVTEKKKIIVITNEDHNEVVQEYFPEAQVLYDQKEGLNDFTTESQENIIKNARVTFQGEDINLSSFIDSTSIGFIKGSVLKKIIRNETITIGKPFNNSKYDAMKHLYVDRRLSRSGDGNAAERLKDKSILVRTFHDVNDDVVVLTAAPGMGKSTLLTRLSITTKQVDKTLWILKINLLDYSRAFNYWRENKIDIDTLETVKFLCGTMFGDKIQITLKEVNDKIYLESCNGDEDISFELNMFLHHYNERELLLLFDGFDEICPAYKDTFLNFLNTVKNYHRQHKMWVASRPYSDILPDLERALGEAYGIQYINDEEQETYLKQYWHFNLREVNYNKDNLAKMIIYFGNPMHKVKTLRTDSFNFKRVITHLFEYLFSLLYEYRNEPEKYFTVYTQMRDIIQLKNAVDQEQDKLIGTPLILYLVADYFNNLIQEFVNHDKFSADFTVQDIYERFITKKLKDILYEEKDRRDVTTQQNIKHYQKDLKECYDLHKKLGAYVLFRNTLFNGECRLPELDSMLPFKEGDSDFLEMIEEFKSGSEKTGLISYVTVDNIPVFIHSTFAEYFAAEYICDIFKSDKFENSSKKLLFYTVYVFNSKDVLPWIKNKTKSFLESDFFDIQWLDSIIFSKSQIFLLHKMWSIKDFIRILASSPEHDYEYNFFNMYFHRYLDSDLDERAKLKIDLQGLLLSQMKADLKKHFTSRHWPVASNGGHSIRYPKTPLRKYLSNPDCIINEKIVYDMDVINKNYSNLRPSTLPNEVGRHQNLQWIMPK